VLLSYFLGSRVRHLLGLHLGQGQTHTV
jgi:hypothetical protein